MKYSCFIILFSVFIFSSCKYKQEENSLFVLDPNVGISFDASKDLLDKQILENPDNDYLYFKRAQLFLGKKYFELAKSDIDNALKFQQSNKYFLLKCKILNQLDDTTELESCLRQLEKEEIEDFEYYEIKSNILYKRKYFRKALEMANYGIQMAPFHNTFYRKKGLCYLAIKDTAKGEKYLRYALENDTNEVNNYYELAHLFQKMHNVAEFQKYLNKGLRLDSLHYGLNVIKGNHLYKLKKLDSALIYYDKSIIQNNKNEEAYYQRAKTYMDLFRFIAAEADWQKVLRLNPNNRIAEKYLAISYLENNRVSNSEKLFEDLYRRDTSDVEVKRYLESIKISKEKFAKDSTRDATLHQVVKTRDTLNK